MTDTMKLWDAVSSTDPANTKHVNQRGGFTSICAQSQIMEATRQFGPIGVGWGYTVGEAFFHETLIFVPVTLWHGDRANNFGPMLGCDEWKDNKGRLDSDAGKKATTDAITKLLSHLGFNADVFLGKFDDAKYVARARREFANDPAPELINDAQFAELQTMIENSGLQVSDLLKAAKIPSLDKLPTSRFEGCKGWIIKHIEQRKEAS